MSKNIAFDVASMRAKMLREMSGSELYRMMIDIPRSSYWLGEVDHMLDLIAEIKLDGMKRRNELPHDELQPENRLKKLADLAVDPEDHREDQLAYWADEQGLSPEEAEKQLREKAKWG